MCDHIIGPHHRLILTGTLTKHCTFSLFWQFSWLNNGSIAFSAIVPSSSYVMADHICHALLFHKEVLRTNQSWLDKSMPASGERPNCLGHGKVRGLQRPQIEGNRADCSVHALKKGNGWHGLATDAGTWHNSIFFWFTCESGTKGGASHTIDVCLLYSFPSRSGTMKTAYYREIASQSY